MVRLIKKSAREERFEISEEDMRVKLFLLLIALFSCIVVISSAFNYMAGLCFSAMCAGIIASGVEITKR